MKGIIFLIFIMIILLFSVPVINNHINFYAESVQIEQLRSDVAKAGVIASEDILGQAVVWNQNIVSNQQYNRMFLINLAIPDGWDSIKIIELPRGK